MRCPCVLAVVVLSGCLLVSAQDIGVDNTFKYIGNGRYSWTVFVTGDANALGQIDKVQYTLHPTFPQPVVWGQGPNFSFSAIGWGEFNILARIFYKDTRRQPTTINHWLRLSPKGS